MRKCTCGANEPIKLVLTAKLRAGKDTAAGYLATFYNVRPFAFADELKKSFHMAFPDVPREPKPRAMYQKFGEWACETLGDKVWVDKVNEAVESHLKHGSAHVLITDMRKPVEYEAVKADGYKIIKIEAAPELRVRRALQAGDDFTAEDLEHQTELYIDNITPDFTVFNNLDEDSLFDQLDHVMAELGIEKECRGE